MTLDRRYLPPIRLELVGFAAILALATVLRLVDLPTRGTWDADQGHDMLVLNGLIHGQVPLLGLPTSIGDFHHGVLYYFLLAPAALVSGADPTAVTAWIALGGVLAVAISGWLARAIAGPVAGLIAALLLAVSASAVEESTFIWNPNLVALTSSIALAAAWRAWQGGRARWWVVAGAAAVATMHCHVLGVILTPVIAALLVADVRRRRRRGGGGGGAGSAAGPDAGAGAVGWAALGWLAIGLLSYVPLAIHELGASGGEIQAAIAFLTSGGGGDGVSLPARIPIVALRVLGWPLTGLITAAPIATLLAALLVGWLAVWRGWLTGATEAAGAEPGGADHAAPDERTAVRWLSLGLVWTILALAAGASGLATVIPGLPNDHYHAFADPMVVVLVGIGLSALARFGLVRNGRVSWPAVPAIAAAAIVVGLVGWNLTRQPAPDVADGGWPAAQRAAAAVVAVTGNESVVLSSLPTFKSDEALRFPLERLGVEVTPRGVQGPLYAGPETPRVILCDQLFRKAIGAECGGPAEDAWIVNPASNLTPAAGTGVGPLRPVTRFEAATGRWISIYRP